MAPMLETGKQVMKTRNGDAIASASDAVSRDMALSAAQRRAWLACGAAISAARAKFDVGVLDREGLTTAIQTACDEERKACEAAAEAYFGAPVSQQMDASL